MKLGELKDTIIEDLRICISYEPNKEHDLLCMMEQYLKSKTRRKELESEIKKLLDNEPYQNPFESDYPYCEDDIMALDEILRSYIEGAEESEEPLLLLENAIININELHDKCQNELIDEWRKPKIEELLLGVAKRCQLENPFSVITENKRWE